MRESKDRSVADSEGDFPVFNLFIGPAIITQKILDVPGVVDAEGQNRNPPFSSLNAPSVHCQRAQFSGLPALCPHPSAQKQLQGCRRTLL